MRFLVVLILLFGGVADATAAMSKAAAAQVNAVLTAAGEMRASGDSEKSWKAFDKAFDPILNARNSVTDEALAALLSFYIGEHPDEDLTCELVSRGRKVLPLLRMYSRHPFKTSGPVLLLGEEERKEHYDSVIKRIEAGEACEREP